MRCSSCGTEMSSGVRFCSNCGTPQSSGDEERRVVTVLFGDVVGFTALAERLDPEDVKHLIDRCFDRLASDIVSFGGVVDKIVGDAVVALFGAPVAHEDDPERAVRAGLRMQQTLATMAAEAESPMQMRIGINTGEVLVGMSSAGGDYTAMGDVMNTASRLESLSEPGQVLVGASTQAATSEAVSYRRLGFLEARGREVAIEAWAALNPIRPPGVRRRRSTSFSGREPELSLIEAQARVAVELHRAQATMIVGEAGMGKTRLAEESASLLSERWNARVLEGRAVPYGEANVWWPIAEAMCQAFNLSMETTPEEAQAVIMGGLSVHLPSEQEENLPRYTTALMHALGYQTPLRSGDRERNRSEVALALINVLEAELERRPVVLILSDVHWAADAVFVMIRHVLSELSRLPLVLIMTAKGSEPPMELHGRHGSLLIHLGPLTHEASVSLLDELDLELPADVAAELVERSGGNPFFLEELAALVASRQAVGQSGEVADLSGGSLTSLPDTLRGIIAERLDALHAQDRAVLEAAAVLGRNGPIAGLSKMVAQSDGIEDIAPSLVQLQDSELLTLDGPRYEFRSEMVRDVAYGTLTKSDRAESHYEIATYLESAAGKSARNSITVAIADHYRSAAQLLNEVTVVPGVDRATAVSKALHWLAEAGERAVDAGAPVDAAKWFSEGLELADDDARATFLYGRGRARLDTHDIVGARADLDRLDQLTGHDPALAARALLVRGELCRKAGETERAAAILREAADRLEGLGDLGKQALALRLLGMTEMMRGDAQLARQALESSRSVAKSLGDSRGEAWALQSLGWHAFQSGHVVEAAHLVEESVVIFEELEDRGGLAWARGLGAWVSFHIGDWDRARILIAEVLPETRRRGDPWGEAVMLNLSASLELWSGRASESLATSREAQEVAERIDDLGLKLQGQAIEGRSLVSVGRVTEGSELLENAFAEADRVGDQEARRFTVVGVTASAARLGESERAIRWAARFDGGHQDPNVLGESDLAVSLALALLQRGAIAEAASQLAWIDVDSNESADRSNLDMYAQAVGAIIAAAQGDTELVDQRAEAVLVGSSTYLDRVFALLAKAAAAYQSRDQSDPAAYLDLARSELVGTDDRVSPLIVDLVAAVCGLESVVEAEARLRGIGVDPAGWRQAWSLAANPGAVRS